MDMINYVPLMDMIEFQREFTLLFLAFAFGGVGALLGMVLWRHKTLKIKFKLAIPFALLWSVYAVGFGYGLWVK